MSTTSSVSSGSGLDYSSWITKLVAIKQAQIDKISAQVAAVQNKENALTSIKSSYSSLSDAIQTFTDAKLNSTDNIFTKKSATSSSTAVTAAVTSGAATQNVKVSVSQLATATKAQSATVAGAYATGASTISDISKGSVTDGTFSIYLDGTKHNITVDKTKSLSDVVTSLKSVVGENNVSITDGKLTIKADSGHTLSVGSTADTSNFSKVFSMVKNEDGSYTSSKSLFTTNASSPLVGGSFAGGTVTEGKFTIGTEEFTIDATTTMEGLVSQINKSTKAGVSASWDSNTGKLVLESTTQGAVNINIEKPATGASNFTDIMKLTNSDGSLISGSQTLGQNAKLSINGTDIVSTSNTVGSDVSGITGLTLTLNDKTTDTANVAVTYNRSALVAAVNTFVSAFNSSVANTTTATTDEGYLKGESILTTLKNKIRASATSSVGVDDSYKTLASIGITTGKVSTDTSAKTSSLVIDSAKLTTAIENDPEAVMKLLIGDGTNDGVMTKLSKTVDDALDSSDGYFTKRTASYDKQISRLNSKISSQTRALESYQKSLEAKFQAMDKIVSALQDQAAQMDTMLSQINSNNNK